MRGLFFFSRLGLDLFSPLGAETGISFLPLSHSHTFFGRRFFPPSCFWWDDAAFPQGKEPTVLSILLFRKWVDFYYFARSWPAVGFFFLLFLVPLPPFLRAKRENAVLTRAYQTFPIFFPMDVSFPFLGFGTGLPCFFLFHPWTVLTFLESAAHDFFFLVLLHSLFRSYRIQRNRGSLPLFSVRVLHGAPPIIFSTPSQKTFSRGFSG